MTDFDPEFVRNQLDPRRIDRAARWAAARLRILDHAVVNLEPGDATRYVIMITAPQSTWDTDGPTHEREYLVATSFGPVYPWAAVKLDWSYVHAKWVANENRWTAVVITEFLNTLASHLPTDEEE